MVATGTNRGLAAGVALAPVPAQLTVHPHGFHPPHPHRSTLGLGPSVAPGVVQQRGVVLRPALPAHSPSPTRGVPFPGPCLDQRRRRLHAHRHRGGAGSIRAVEQLGCIPKSHGGGRGYPSPPHARRGLPPTGPASLALGLFFALAYLVLWALATDPSSYSGMVSAGGSGRKKDNTKPSTYTTAPTPAAV